MPKYWFSIFFLYCHFAEKNCSIKVEKRYTAEPNPDCSGYPFFGPIRAKKDSSEKQGHADAQSKNVNVSKLLQIN